MLGRGGLPKLGARQCEAIGLRRGRRPKVRDRLDRTGHVEQQGVGVEVRDELDPAVPHRRHGGAGLGAGGREVGAKGLVQRVNVGDAVAFAGLGDSRGLDVGVQNIDGRRLPEELGFQQVAIRELVSKLGHDVGP